MAAEGWRRCDECGDEPWHAVELWRNPRQGKVAFGLRWGAYHIQGDSCPHVTRVTVRGLVAR
jgi:hypothetical protein